MVKDFLLRLGYGELPALIIFGVALLLFFICLYGLIRKKKFIYGLAVVVLIAVMALVNPYQYVYNMFARSKAGDTTVQSALKRLATAQEGYFKDHNRYTKNLGAVAEYGFKQESYPGVLIIINQANGRKWSARAGHQYSENRYTYSSETGEVTKVRE